MQIGGYPLAFILLHGDLCEDPFFMQVDITPVVSDDRNDEIGDDKSYHQRQDHNGIVKSFFLLNHNLTS